jgi:hypothetical protein
MFPPQAHAGLPRVIVNVRTANLPISYGSVSHPAFQLGFTGRSDSPQPSQKVANIYKSAIYSFYLPMGLSMIICGFPVESASPMGFNYYDFALDILLPLGEYAQIQEEYLESRAGSLSKSRSWCYDLVRSTGSPEQLAVLDAHLGKEDATSQLHIRSVFAEAGVDARYSLYAEDAYTRVGALIDALPEVRSPSGDAVLAPAIFRALLEDLHTKVEVM